MADRSPSDVELRAVVRLATGAGDAGAPVDWAHVFDVATAERCAIVTWLRGGAHIRRDAPRDVVARWRALAVASAELARVRAARLGEVAATLGSAGVAPVVIKGLPLAVSLHGDASARPVSDSDLYVPRDQREAAHGALLAAGWTHLYGGPDSEGTYRRDEPEGPHFLEIHSSLLDENMLAHLVVPAPQGQLVDVEGTALFAQCGPLLPVFLAVHLAKHPNVPLLWWIDFATLYRRMTPSEREAAAALAERCRLERFLAWAIGGAQDLTSAAADDPESALGAMRSLRSRHEHAPVARLSRLAASIADGARICLAWALPRNQRGAPLALARETLSRGLRWGRRQLRQGGEVAHGR